MARETSYQPLNYRAQNVPGTDHWQVDGELDVGETGVLSFFDEELTGSRGRALARNLKAAVVIINSVAVMSAQGGSSPPVLPSEYGTIIFSMGLNSVTEMSCRLFSAIPGQRLHLRCSPSAGQSGIVTFYGSDAGFTGVKILGSTGSYVSSIQITASGASFGWVDLMGVDDGVWSVVGAGNLVTERPA
jgi:hypothetical protein